MYNNNLNTAAVNINVMRMVILDDDYAPFGYVGDSAVVTVLVFLSHPQFLKTCF